MDTPPKPLSALNGLRLVAIGAMLLVLLVPHWMIADLIAEREARSDEASREIGAAWGRPQTLVPPVIVIPWRAPVSRDANGVLVTQRGAVAVLPTELSAEADLAPETRRRGLFEATVYLARVGLSGTFTLPPVAVPDVPEAELLWREAFVTAGSDELRPAGLAPALTLDGRRIEPGEMEIPDGLCAAPENLRWPLGLSGPPAPGEAMRFDLRMELRGSEGFRIIPLARRASVVATGAWPTPSFAGTELPAATRVAEDGFRAEWATGTRLPLVRRTIASCGYGNPPVAAAIGVDLLQAVPTYRMVNRAAKYTFLFLVLTFVTCALFEMTAGIRLHPVQYGLLGASVVLFPLLLLAVGEPLGFGAAYAVSTAAVVAQASVYAATAARRALGLVLAGVLAALFAFLHVVLSLEAYALLAGTLALFLVLSVVMAATRRIRWAAA